MNDTSSTLIELHVNGKSNRVAAGTDQTLLDVLRDTLELTGVRGACGIGMCGACTLLVDGVPLSSCLLLPHQVEGKEVLTIEGLAPYGQLHPVQQAYVDHAAFQCAYCTPGFVLATVALLEENPDPDADAIRHYLAGNLCRCGSYANILSAVRASASELGSPPEP